MRGVSRARERPSITEFFLDKCLESHSCELKTPEKVWAKELYGTKSLDLVSCAIQ